MGIEYDGAAYNGWQRQQNGTGVQELVEKALAAIGNETTDVFCAGRTDTGVHASGQVIHFDTAADRSSRSWVMGANSKLPDDINATWAKIVDRDFHARFSATCRHYQYRIFNCPIRSSLHRNRAWWVCQTLDDRAMQEGAMCLLGEHDFSAFRASGCQASTPVRTVTSINISREHRWITLNISANAFLQHMVRNVVGTLAAVGLNEQPQDWVAEVLESRDRSLGGMAAPAHGLTLMGVRYPQRCDLPEWGGGPLPGM